MLKKLRALFIVILIFAVACPACTFSQQDMAQAQATDVAQAASNFRPFFNIFGRRSKIEKPERKDERKVFVGGVPIGFSLTSDGIIVVGFSDVETERGAVSPAKNCGIAVGDILTEIESERIGCIEDIDRIINAEYNRGRELEIKLTRGGSETSVRVAPAAETKSGKFKLGLWIKDTAAGVGTVTYITPEMRFGALGHPICDGETGVIVPVKDGTAYKCNIIGLNKSVKGKPGELKGLFLKNKNIVGTVEKNNVFGIFGEFDALPENLCRGNLVSVMPRSDVRPGKASIITTVGNKSEEYEIEIVKALGQKHAQSKGIIIKVTDKRLLEKTGGIVQGMSGSPILQNGKLVGAVTHVFVNDPLRGYGIYAEWMLDN